MRDPGSIPRGVLMWNWDSPVSDVLLHWWPRHDWSLWPHLRGALSRIVAMLSYRQCDNPTWSHTALLSQFHACCRSSFQIHNRHSRLLGGSPVESLQSHCILIISHWSSGLPVCFPSWGTRFQSPGGYLCETGILLLAMSCYNATEKFRNIKSSSLTFALYSYRVPVLVRCAGASPHTGCHLACCIPTALGQGIGTRIPWGGPPAHAHTQLKLQEPESRQ
jgi:hypothetical protein